MNGDAEFAQWQRQWQATRPRSDIDAADALKRRTTRESRLQIIWMIAPILVTIGIGGGAVARALTSASPADVLFAAEVWVFILATWAGSLWIARGTWRPLAETTAAFVDISIRRRRSNLRAVSFGAWLYVCQLLFVVLWKLLSSGSGLTALLTSWPLILLGWVGVPMFFAWRSWFIRGQRAELDRLLELERQLRAGPADEP
ncbi:MAG TPA: hypothetical protein VFJ95_04830 [Gammaproteobacteria bacterium]|nr:hypothetical protein [Gammaproteobacteria bacterium]